jgi:hypothetical protein
MPGTRNNRASRVERMLAALWNNSNTRKLKREPGSRHLIAPGEKHILISNKPNIFGVNMNNENTNSNFMSNLSSARKSIIPSPRRFQGVRLNAKQSKLFANFSAAHDDPEEMLETLRKFQQRILSSYYG